MAWAETMRNHWSRLDTNLDRLLSSHCHRVYPPQTAFSADLSSSDHFGRWPLPGLRLWPRPRRIRSSAARPSFAGANPCPSAFSALLHHLLLYYFLLGLYLQVKIHCRPTSKTCHIFGIVDPAFRYPGRPRFVQFQLQFENQHVQVTNCSPHWHQFHQFIIEKLNLFAGSCLKNPGFVRFNHPFMVTSFLRSKMKLPDSKPLMESRLPNQRPPRTSID